MITIGKEIHNNLVDKFDARAENFQLKGKAYIKAQAEFFIGAVSVSDLLNGGDKSSINPRVYFSIMRGEKITKFEDKNED